jgi:hypothetical protein
VEEKEVWGGRGSEAEEVMGVWMDLDRKRWRAAKECCGLEEGHKERWR